MSPAQREEAWSDFTHAFFSPPNDLAPDADQTTTTIVGWAREAWLRSPASPFFLPVNASGWTRTGTRSARIKNSAFGLAT